jgi:protein-S-isoprenylcysteine O-methyltransferase Ste14
MPNVETTPIPVIAILTVPLLYHFAVLIAWLGGAAFAAALAYLAYFYCVTLASTSGNPSQNLAHTLVDISLFAAFATHHSLFARRRGKQLIARLVPARLERAAYVWAASALAVGMGLLWQPVAGRVYEVEGLLRLPFWAIQVAGAALTVLGAREVSAFELAGINQAAGRTVGGNVRIVGPFRFVRHPIYLGWVLIVFGTPTLTANRLVFAAVSTLYLILAIPWEERSLAADHGDQYRAYQQKVRWRLLPGIW